MRLYAVDADTGQLVQSFGDGGSVILTEGLGRDADSKAFDKTTGTEVWRGATSYRTTGNPMTYRTSSGRQFVAIATGAGARASLIAYALLANRNGR